MRPMLAQLMPEHTTASVYLNNPAWTLEQKLDGQRLLIEVEDREAKGYNRKGDPVKIPDNIAANFDQKAFAGKWVFDGEILGTTYFVFDCIEAVDLITPDSPHRERFDFLKDLVERWNPTNIALIPHAEGPAKAGFFAACQVNQVEGVVFKMKIGKYRPGKRTIENLKCKFTTTADVIVTELNRDGSKQGVSTAIIHNGNKVDAGGCKIPKDAIGLVKENDVIEVKYLYASNDHKLVQPIWVCLRTDKHPAECTTDQLKYTNKEAVHENLS